MPLTRTKDGEAPRLGTDVLLSRNAVVELRSGALESVRPMANSFSCFVPSLHACHWRRVFGNGCTAGLVEKRARANRELAGENAHRLLLNLTEVKVFT